MLKRQTTGSVVCPSCGKLVSVNAHECYNCGRKNPGLWGFGPSLMRLLGTGGGFVPVVTAACIVLYVASLLLDIRAAFQLSNPLYFLSPSMKSLYALGMTGTIPMAHGRWWTLLTAIYLHGGLLHIVFNVLWIRQIGPAVEDLFGTARLILIFTISGAFGFVVSNWFGHEFTIGASGSIFGLLGALVYYGRTRGGTFGAAIFKQTAIWAVVLFIFGAMMSATNNMAHGGGFVGGYVAAQILGFAEARREQPLHRLLAAVAVAATLVGFVLSVTTAF